MFNSCADIGHLYPWAFSDTDFGGCNIGEIWARYPPYKISVPAFYLSFCHSIACLLEIGLNAILHWLRTILSHILSIVLIPYHPFSAMSSMWADHMQPHGRCAGTGFQLHTAHYKISVLLRGSQTGGCDLSGGHQVIIGRS